MKKATITRLEALDYVGSESLNTLCSNLSFAGNGRKKLLFTGVTEGDGASHVAMRVTETLAGRGQRVVLVDCDLRASKLADRYGITVQGGAGLSDYLTGEAKAEDVLYETNLPGVYLVPQGHPAANPAGLLHSAAFAALLDELAAQFDAVLLDTPPVGQVVDAAEAAARCDGAVLVCAYGKTRRRDLALAKRQLEAAGCAVLGCVINRITFDTFSSRLHDNREDYTRFRSHLKKSRSRS